MQIQPTSDCQYWDLSLNECARDVVVPVTTTTSTTSTTTPIPYDYGYCSSEAFLQSRSSPFIFSSAKYNKIQFRSANSVYMRVNIFNNDPNKLDNVDIQNAPYKGYLLWSKKICGIDFLRAWEDGRLSYEMLDHWERYTPQYVGIQLAQAQTKVVLQFSASHREDYDLMDETKKDQFYLVITGLASVDFGNKDVDACLTGLKPGHFNGIPEDMDKDDTLCVAERFWV